MFYVSILARMPEALTYHDILYGGSFIHL